jgi:hypothetical protein
VKKVTIGLDVERELKFNINAVVELENRFNKPFHQVMSQETVGIETLRTMAYIGLKHGGLKFKGKDIEENEAMTGELLQEHWFAKKRTLSELMVLVGEALNEAGVFNTTEEEEDAANTLNPKKGAA